MKNFSKSSILTIIVSSIFALGPIAAFAASPLPVDLGVSGNFAIFSETGITDIPSSIVTGDVGSTPITGAATLLTCPEVTGTIYSNDAAGPMPCRLTNAAFLTTAMNNMVTAYNVGAGMTVPAPETERNAGLFVSSSSVSSTFTAGIYKWSSDVLISDDITLSGSASDVWIFQIAGDLDLAAKGSVPLGVKIKLSGGADAKNVFWIVHGAVNGVTLGTYSTFNGTILSGLDIHLRTGAVLNGRALSQTQVTLDHATVTLPIPTVSPVVVSTGGHRRVNPIVPIVGITKVPSPLALPLGAGKVTYNYTVWNVGGLQPLIDVTVVDDKCSPVVLNSGDLNNDKILDINEKWNYSCSATLTSTTTNTAIATAHSDDGYYNTAVATAIATVAVGTAVQPPLVHVVKVPSQLTELPYGGGNITYTYSVTNPGVVALKNVLVSDDKCSNVFYSSGDVNGNGMLDTTETWIYTCAANVPVSTGSVATAKGDANGLTALAYSFVNVLVGSPILPQTGLPGATSTSWNIIVLSGIIVILSVSLIVVSRKNNA